MNDQNTPSEPVEETEAPEPATTAVEPVSDQPEGSATANMPPEAPESPTNASIITPVEDQNPPINQPESSAPEQPISVPNEPETPVDDQPVSEPIQSTPTQSVPVPAPTSPTPFAPQSQSSAQQEEVGFIHSLLVKAQAKIQSNKQKKLNEIIQLAQKKQIIKNEDVQKLLRISSATATRYLVKLVQQGHLTRVGSPRDAKYQFVN